ncbi:hypothetical protein [Pseudomonas umsongensis]|jgi:hypothetical protein|uniref:hypothetical protein n=1 Tax=Pseudomonas umsongensis TaxID=198618 RepID=UPI00200A7F8C|nr:hypothetical protein [Pseudomonas umsongensis]MCK8685312.1 hypothetical protein [Pseudomonas umsongensis]
MSAKTDVEAIRLIGEEVVRLLSLPEEKLEPELGKDFALLVNSRGVILPTGDLNNL